MAQQTFRQRVVEQYRVESYMNLTLLFQTLDGWKAFTEKSEVEKLQDGLGSLGYSSVKIEIWNSRQTLTVPVGGTVYSCQDFGLVQMFGNFIVIG